MGKPTSNILLNEHRNKRIPKDILLYPQNRALFSPYQISTSLQQVGINTDIHMQTSHRELEKQWRPRHHNLPLQGPGGCTCSVVRCMWRPEVGIGVIFCHSPPYLRRQGLCLPSSDRPAGQRAPGILPSLPTQCCSYRSMLGVRTRSSSCAERTLLTELSPHIAIIFKNLNLVQKLVELMQLSGREHLPSM